VPRSGYRPLRGTTCRQGAKLAVWQGERRRRVQDFAGRTRRTPGRAPSSYLESAAQRAYTQTATTTASLSCACAPRRSKVGVALLKVHLPLPDVAFDPFRVSGTSRARACSCRGSCQDLSPPHLNVVTVARLVQILGTQVTPACATRRAPYHRPPLPEGLSHPVA